LYLKTSFRKEDKYSYKLVYNDNMKSDQQHTDRSRTKNSVLYKYLDIEGAKMMLSNKTLQFTNAMQFNDPFDCDPNLIDFSKVPSERCKTWTSDIIESLAFDQYRRNREDVWVCCLSKVFDSLLMWAYYNNHRGVCIGLNMEKVAKYFDASLGLIVDKHAHEVQYRDIIEKPDYFQNEEDFFHYQMCTKAKVWEHEQEARMFIFKPFPWIMLPDSNNKSDLIDRKEVRAFPRIGGECFESIYLGVNINEKESGLIKIAKKLNPDIKVYQMKKNTNAFKLDAIHINDE
jgi:hypothetical protein